MQFISCLLALAMASIIVAMPGDLTKRNCPRATELLPVAQALCFKFYGTTDTNNEVNKCERLIEELAEQYCTGCPYPSEIVYDAAFDHVYCTGVGKC